MIKRFEVQLAGANNYGDYIKYSYNWLRWLRYNQNIFCGYADRKGKLLCG